MIIEIVFMYVCFFLLLAAPVAYFTTIKRFSPEKKSTPVKPHKYKGCPVRDWRQEDAVVGSVKGACPNLCNCTWHTSERYKLRSVANASRADAQAD